MENGSALAKASPRSRARSKRKLVFRPRKAVAGGAIAFARGRIRFNASTIQRFNALMRRGIARRFAVLILSVAFALRASSALAVEISGVKLPDQLMLEGKTLKLNGVGLRQAKLVVNVYAAGLYLESPAHDADAIADSDQLKSIEIVFMRETSGKQMREALEEGFNMNCVADCARLKSEVIRLEGWLRDIKKGETMAYHFLPGGVEVIVRGQKVGMIDDKAFGHQFIRCWIGKNPPNPALKEGLLGLKK
jgi:Chalcone isomerase-like